MQGTTLTALLALVLFGFVTSVTPGPNNTYLLASGMNFGLKKSLVYVNGIMVGLLAMFTGIYLGVGALFRLYPLIQEILKYIGFAYILYIAFGIIRSTFSESAVAPKQIGFIQATFFQLVNPKAWIVLLSAVSTYVPPTTNLVDVLILLGVFLVATYPGAVIWAAFGQVMASWLSKPTPRRIFNVSAAVLLVFSMLAVLFS